MAKIKKQVTIGTDADGKRIRKWVYADTKEEFNRIVRDLKNPREISFDEYAKKWLLTYKCHKAINTIASYENTLKKCDSIAQMPLYKVKRSDIQIIINHNIEFTNSCRKLAMTLKQIFNAALDDGLVDKNPAVRLSIPHDQPKEKRALTQKERDAIKSVVLDPYDKMYLDLLYYCGIRRGEALALTRSDFDFTGLLLSVNKSIAFDKNTPVLKDSKTHMARYVPIPECKTSDWSDMLAGLPFILFSNDNGYITKSSFRKKWDRIEKAINTKLGGSDTTPTIHITPHMIRHDYATRLYYVPGISNKKKAYILGHSEKLFLELYSHLDDGYEMMSEFQNNMKFMKVENDGFGVTKSVTNPKKYPNLSQFVPIFGCPAVGAIPLQNPNKRPFYKVFHREPSGTRTPDNLIKSQVLFGLFMRFIGCVCDIFVPR